MITYDHICVEIVGLWPHPPPHSLMDPDAASPDSLSCPAPRVSPLPVPPPCIHLPTYVPSLCTPPVQFPPVSPSQPAPRITPCMDSLSTHEFPPCHAFHGAGRPYPTSHVQAFVGELDEFAHALIRGRLPLPILQARGAHSR